MRGFGKASSGGMSFSQLSKAGIAPKVADAPYLAHAFSIDSCDFEKRTLTCLKSGVISKWDGTTGTVASVLDESNESAGRFYWEGSGVSGSRAGSIIGEWEKIGADESYMVMAVGWHGIGENALIFRLGGWNQESHIRIHHTGYISGIADVYTGDTNKDDSGNNIGQQAARWSHPPTDPQDDPTAHFTDPQPCIIVSLFDRDTGTYHLRSWSITQPDDQGSEWTGGVQVESFDASNIVDAFTLGTEGKPESMYETTTGMSVVGHFFGMALWKFPAGKVPANWYEAARSMGYAWSKGRFHFYPF